MRTQIRTLKVLSADGLCNRLLVLLSGRAIAEASGRIFSMDWLLSNTCNCPFDWLFQDNLDVQLAHTIDPNNWRDLRRTPRQKFPNLAEATEQHLRIRYNNWLIQPDRFPAHKALFARAVEMFQQMNPIAPITARVDAFQADHFRPTMIGLHLRRGDYVVGRPDRVDNLAEAQNAVDRWLDYAPDAGILLCTDDGAPAPFSSQPSPYQGVREHFRQRYGDRVVTPTPRSLDRGSPEAIQDAVMELWLLRRTQYFAGTTDSTFSEMAGLGRDIPTVMTHGQTAAYQRRLLGYKRSGLYHLLMTLGRLEFGEETSYFFISNLYKERSVRIKNALRRKR